MCSYKTGKILLLFACIIQISFTDHSWVRLVMVNPNAVIFKLFSRFPDKLGLIVTGIITNFEYVIASKLWL